MNRRRVGRISVIREFLLLTQQYGMILLGNSKDLIVTLIFPFVAMLITTWIAEKNMFITFEDTKTACFVLVSVAIWGGLFNSIQTIVKERAMIKRDIVSGGMRIGCFTASRVLLQMILCLLQTAILCLAFVGVKLVYEHDLPTEGLLTDHPVLELYFSLFLVMFAADAMGLLISCYVKKAETASVMAPYILIAQLVFSGTLFKMEGIADYISYAMISRWGMEAMGSICDCNARTLKIIESTEDEMTRMNLEKLLEKPEDVMFTYEAEHLIKVWLILAAFILVFIIVSDILLHRVKKDSRD